MQLFHDPPQQHHGWLARVGAGWKLAVAVSLIVTAALARERAWPLIGAGFAIVIVFAIISRVPLRPMLKRILLLEPFVLGIAVLALFQPDGWHLFLLLAARSTLCLTVVLLLAFTTPFSEILKVLRRLRVPALLVTTLALAYRYLAVLISELDRMRRARAGRAYTKQQSRVWTGLATMIALLFVRSSLRAERVFAAMCARGWKA